MKYRRGINIRMTHVEINFLIGLIQSLTIWVESQSQAVTAPKKNRDIAQRVPIKKKSREKTSECKSFPVWSGNLDLD